GTPYERIDVVVHPQSLVHGLVQMADGAMLAHLGPPDMRIAISYALHGGESVELPVAPLDLAAVGALTFAPVDLDAFPCLRLARSPGLRHWGGELDPDPAGHHRADHPARARPFRRRQGRRHARRALLAVLPADAVPRAPRRDRVCDRRDPCRRLRKDHRDEPGRARGARPGGRAAGLLRAVAVEAHGRGP